MTLSQGMELVLMLALLVLLIVAGVLVSRMRMLATSLEVTLARLQSEMSKLVNEVTELVDEAGEDVSKFEPLPVATNAVTARWVVLQSSRTQPLPRRLSRPKHCELVRTGWLPCSGPNAPCIKGDDSGQEITVVYIGNRRWRRHQYLGSQEN